MLKQCRQLTVLLHQRLNAVKKPVQPATLKHTLRNRHARGRFSLSVPKLVAALTDARCVSRGGAILAFCDEYVAFEQSWPGMSGLLLLNHDQCDLGDIPFTVMLCRVEIPIQRAAGRKAIQEFCLH